MIGWKRRLGGPPGGCGNLACREIRCPDRPARSMSLYLLLYMPIVIRIFSGIRCVFPTTVTTSDTVFWDVKPCSGTESSLGFGEARRLFRIASLTPQDAVSHHEVLLDSEKFSFPVFLDWYFYSHTNIRAVFTSWRTTIFKKLILCFIQSVLLSCSQISVVISYSETHNSGLQVYMNFKVHFSFSLPVFVSLALASDFLPLHSVLVFCKHRTVIIISNLSDDRSTASHHHQ
jgi:hypothetical protein